MTKVKEKSAEAITPPPPTTSPWARPAVSSVHGTGLYASQAIPKGTRVIEYVGEKITKAESDRRDAARIARQEEGDDGCVYLFELNQRYDLDGDVEWNTARLINHSCEPNCETENVNGHIWISALRDIAADEELSYDYGFDWENGREHPCRCGSPDCFGYIVKRSQRKKVTKWFKAEAKRKKKAGKKSKAKKKKFIPPDLASLSALLASPSVRTLAVAESLTCGQLQAAIGSVSGASAFFLGGVTAYTLDQKVKHLGVDRSTARACNCVSESTAREMARGVMALFGADLGLATTGYAEADQRVGIAAPFAWWALAGRNLDGTLTELSGSVECPGLTRIEVQAKVTAHVLTTLLDHLRTSTTP